jgi:sec-independent protein translocase protein TatB
MFDVGFSEIVVIMVVALVVIGPDRLPAVARTMGKWWGGMQRYVNRIKMDVASSMELDELRELERKIKAEADALERSVQQTGRDINQQMQKLEKEIDQPVPDASKPAPPAEPTLPLK